MFSRCQPGLTGLRRSSFESGLVRRKRGWRGSRRIALACTEALEQRQLLSTIHVDADAAGVHDGTSWDSAYADLQPALERAGQDDEIWVAGGTYKPTAGYDRRIAFLLKNGVGLYGGFAGGEIDRSQRDWVANPTILSGDLGTPGDFGENSYHVVVAHGVDATAILDGFTVTGGNANGYWWDPWGEDGYQRTTYGGGILNNSGSPTISNVIFSGNRALNEGGAMEIIRSNIYPNVPAAPTMINVSFIGNSVPSGWGGAIANHDSATITGSAFSGNSASAAGAISSYGNSVAPVILRITDTTFENNSAGSVGALANISSASATLTHVRFTNNRAINYNGGAIENDQGSSLVITDGTFIGNSASGGGAIFNSASSLTITNATFRRNSASEAGAIELITTSPTPSTGTITDVVFEGNTAGGGGAIVNSNSTRLAITNAIFSGNSVSGYYGGAILNAQYASLDIRGSVFSGNSFSSGEWRGGAIYNESLSYVGMANSIVWGNGGAQMFDYNYYPDHYAVSFTDFQGGWPGLGNVNADPLFVRNPSPGADGAWGTADDDYGDLHLQRNSPAINAGSNAALPADTADLDGDGDKAELLPLDLDGNPRVAGPAVDMGAYEPILNSPPTAGADEYRVDEDGVLEVGAPGVLVNDADIDGDPLTVQGVVDAPEHGELTLNEDGSFRYVPDGEYNGPDEFTYRAWDGQAASEPTLVRITVDAVNDAPGFVGGADQAVLEDAGAQSAAHWATGLIAGPADEAGQALEFEVSNDHSALFSIQPAIAPNGTLTYTLAANASGTAKVTVRLHDDGGTERDGVDTSVEQTFTIAVTAVADAPVLTVVSPASGEEGAAIALSILPELVDTDGSERLSIRIGGVPANAALSAGTDLGDGAWIVAPEDLAGLSIRVDDDGSFDLSVTATATENSNDTAAATETGLEVNVLNLRPVAAIVGATSGFEGDRITLRSSVADPSPADQAAGFTYAWSVLKDGAPYTSGTGADLVLIPDDNGTYLVTLIATDKDGAASEPATHEAVIDNVAPVSAGAIVTPEVDENGVATLTGSFTDAGAADTHDVLVEWGDGTSSVATVDAETRSFSASHQYLDDDPTATASDSYTIRATVEDDDGGVSDPASASVIVHNIAPVAQILSPASGFVVPVGTAVQLAGSFTDSGQADTHRAFWTLEADGMGNGTSSVAGTVSEGDGAVAGAVSFTAPGVYQVRLKVVDDDGGSGEAGTVDGLPATIVVYDPFAGSVSGGGWIDSPAGAYGGDMTLSGKASFAFVSKYEKGATTPSGRTQFRFHAGSLDFRSSSYDWMVVAGSKVQFKGTGTINGEGNYGFMITAIDGSKNGSADRFRIKIWDKGTGTVIYDNQRGDDDGKDPSTALGGGNIVIHDR